MSKRKKHNLQWIKTTLDLNENHNWQSQPGTRIFVAGRGAVRFDVPDDWHFAPQENSFQFLDKSPPMMIVVWKCPTIYYLSQIGQISPLLPF